MRTTTLGRPLDLACGATLPDRSAKAAMSEGLANENGLSIAADLLEQAFGLSSNLLSEAECRESLQPELVRKV